MNNKSVLGWLLSRVRRRIPGLLLLTAAGVGTSLLGVRFALGTKDVINSAVGGSQQALTCAALVQGGIILALLACATLQRYLHYRLNADLDRDWKQGLTHRILHSDYAQMSAYHSGELINRLNNDVRAVDEGLLSVLPSAASMITRLVAVLIVLLQMEPLFTVALLVAGIVVALLTGAARRYLRELNKEVSASEGKVSGFLQEIFEKLLLVQAMNVEQEVERRGDGLMQTRYSLQRKRRTITLVANTCVSVLGYVSGFAALVWCATGLYNGTMTFGELTAVTQLVSQLQGPFVNLSGIFPKYIAMTAACERLMELEDACKTEDAETADVDYSRIGAICAEKLSFSYGRDMVLSDCDFRLSKGSFAVITGPSGIGKSTLLKLLLGIFKTTQGRLYFEHDGKQVDVSRATRTMFAYVPQGNLLFSGTLRENLLLTNPQATEEQIRQAIYVSNMDEYLAQLPKGLETQLGENAHGLSEGQAQRLSIARAILGGAPILLLDEATSALDEKTEETVLQRIRQLSDKTCIAVTHRPAAMALADVHFQVQQGSIVCKVKGEEETK